MLAEQTVQGAAKEEPSEVGRESRRRDDSNRATPSHGSARRFAFLGDRIEIPNRLCHQRTATTDSTAMALDIKRNAGKMAEILMLQSEDRAKLDALTAKLEHFVDADPARLLDPLLVRLCPWGIRSSTTISLDNALTLSIQARGVHVRVQAVRQCHRRHRHTGAHALLDHRCLELRAMSTPTTPTHQIHSVSVHLSA